MQQHGKAKLKPNNQNSRTSERTNKSLKDARCWLGTLTQAIYNKTLLFSSISFPGAAAATDAAIFVFLLCRLHRETVATQAVQDHILSGFLNLSVVIANKLFHRRSFCSVSSHHGRRGFNFSGGMMRHSIAIAASVGNCVQHDVICANIFFLDETVGQALQPRLQLVEQVLKNVKFPTYIWGFNSRYR